MLPAPPCRLKTRATPLEIVLIGENHHTPLAQQIRAIGVRRATAGEIAFLSETSNTGALLPSDPPKRSTLIGLESNAGISLLIAYDIRAPKSEYDAKKAISLLKTYLPRSPILSDAVRDATAGHPERASFDDGDTEANRQLISAITTEVFRLASTKYAAQLDGGAWPDVPYNVNSPDYESLHTRILSLRDRDFARTAGHEICGLAKSFRRIFINVGDAHAPEMQNYLERTFGSAITVRYLEWDKPEDGQTALRLLRE